MKHLFTIVLFCITFNSVYSQSVTPIPTGEFCPNTEYTFTVSIPNTFKSIIGNAGSSVTLQPLAPVGNKFTFKGKFADANQKQWFRINYEDATFYDIEFKNIKSLYYSSISTAIPPCNVIIPNQTSVIFPRCLVKTATISFPNIQWFTNYENPEICFGTVTDYEYLLPSNWKLGTTTSDGSTWIGAGNSVGVTSDLSTGDNSDIGIRASNKTCAVGLAANGPVTLIHISRPAPSFTFTNSTNQICNGSNGVYTINGMPAGSTVVWSIANTDGTSTTLAQIAGSNTNPTVTVAANATTAGLIKITATVTHCTYTYTPSQTLQIGTGKYPTVRLNYDANCGKLFQAIPYFTGDDGIGTTGFSWNLSGDVNLNKTTTDDLVINPLINNPINNKTYKVFVNVKAITGCGTSIQNPYVYVVNIGPVNLNACNGGGGELRQLVNSNSVGDNITTATSFETSSSKISISPNPSNGQFIVILNAKNKHTGIKQIIIKNKMGMPVYRQTFKNNQQRQNINISGNATDIYIVEIFDGKQWITQKLSLQR